jgi:hypothetical protein
MNTQFEYYYNNVPGKGLCRNNLIYTSLISKDRKTFCQWYFNDNNYHSGHNEVVDPQLMEEKWHREIKFYHMMHKHYPEHLLQIEDVDFINKKVYYTIEDVDFWELARCNKNNFDAVLPDWEEQMISIFQAYKKLGLYKFSIHPSSYFVVNGKLRSTNYFFTYDNHDHLISVNSVLSHISKDRRKHLFPQLEKLGINLYEPTPFASLQKLAFSSFKTDYPSDIMDRLCLDYMNTTTV